MANLGKRSKRSSGRGGSNEEGGVSHDGNKPYFLLQLHVRSASNVDQLVGPFVPTRNSSGYYLVIITDSQYSTQCKTQIVKGNPQPFWGCNLEMEFDEFPEDVSLFVEVLELGNKHDPGTSTGVVVVGRAQIPVPTKRGDFGWRRQGLVTLMGSETKVEGFIELHMELNLQNGTDFP